MGKYDFLHDDEERKKIIYKDDENEDFDLAKENIIKLKPEISFIRINTKEEIVNVIAKFWYLILLNEGVYISKNSVFINHEKGMECLDIITLILNDSNSYGSSLEKFNQQGTISKANVNLKALFNEMTDFLFHLILPFQNKCSLFKISSKGKKIIKNKNSNTFKFLHAFSVNLFILTKTLYVYLKKMENEFKKYDFEFFKINVNFIQQGFTYTVNFYDYIFLSKSSNYLDTIFCNYNNFFRIEKVSLDYAEIVRNAAITAEKKYKKRKFFNILKRYCFYGLLFVLTIIFIYIYNFFIHRK